MTRHKKAPEFQCHVKYRNELPLPPFSAVLLDASLTLPMDDLSAALQAASAYTPTSLEQGTTHFKLPPIDFLRSELFDWVDLESTRFKAGGKAQGLPEDKELLTLVDAEPAVSSSSFSSANSATSTSVVKTSTSTAKKAARPEVTWLRRTEYISSLRPAAAASNSAANQDEAKASLAEPVEFSQILSAVKESFTLAASAPASHPFKADVSLLQSFPVVFDDSAPLSHCLFLGEAGKRLEERSLLQVRDLKDGSGTVATLLLPETEGSSVYCSPPDHLEFDIQRTATTQEKKSSFVLMLPMGEGEQGVAALSSINATFALRKRRKARNARSKGASKQRIQVSRQ